MKKRRSGVLNTSGRIFAGVAATILCILFAIPLLFFGSPDGFTHDLGVMLAIAALSSVLYVTYVNIMCGQEDKKPLGALVVFSTKRTGQKIA